MNFSLNRDVTVGEVVAVLVVIGGAFGFLYNHFADRARVESGEGIVGIYWFSHQQCELVLSFPVEYFNSGTRATTFERFIPGDLPKVIYFAGDKVSENAPLNMEFYLLFGQLRTAGEVIYAMDTNQ